MQCKHFVLHLDDIAPVLWEFNDVNLSVQQCIVGDGLLGKAIHAVQKLGGVEQFFAAKCLVEKTLEILDNFVSCLCVILDQVQWKVGQFFQPWERVLELFGVLSMVLFRAWT